MARTSDAKDRIIRAASTLIHERGFEHVGVQEICQAADVRKGSFYHFFASKDDLIIDVLDFHWKNARSQYWRLALGGDLLPLDRLRRFFHMAYYYSKQASEAKGALWGCPFGNTGVELGARNQRIVGKISEIFDDAIDHLQTTLQEAVRNGELTNIDPRETATAIWAFYEGALVLAKARQEPELIRDLGDTYIQMLRSGSPT